MADGSVVKESLKSMLIDYLKGLSQELIGETFGYGMLKNLLSKTRSGAGKGPEHEKHIDVVLGGIFNLSDETAFFALQGKMGSTKVSSDAFAKVNSLINNKLTEKWMKKRMRLILGYLSEIDYEIKKMVESGKKIPQKGKPPIEVDAKFEIKKINLGVETVKGLSKLTEEQFLILCETSGILELPLSHKIRDYVNQNKNELVDNINGLKSKIPNRNGSSDFFTREYRGFWREFFGTFGFGRKS